MSSANIGWLFYKEYFRGLDYANLGDAGNEELINEKVQTLTTQAPTINSNEPLGNMHFNATTTYPGLLLGSGNAHEIPDLKGQVILGFHFDYTTGLPVIQGSSVKGVLRSAFKHPEYIQELVDDDSLDIRSLEEEIFDNGDIFFDAEISQIGTSLLGDDYLTPHGDDPLKNPIPLRFIKVMPNVTFRFDFELGDGILAKKEKVKLFQDILEDLGLGAKTNVGYGKFENFSRYQTEKERQDEEIRREKQKEQDELIKQQKIEHDKRQKAQKAEDGIEQLKSCKDIKSAMKILNDSLGKKPSPTPEQQATIEQFWKKHGKKASKSEIKFFKKYHV